MSDDVFARLRRVETMPELDAMRAEVLAAMKEDGTQETFETVQRAFRQAKNRLRRIPVMERGW